MPNHSSLPPVFVLAAPGLPGQTLAAALGRNPAAYDLPELNLEMMPTIHLLEQELIGIRATQIHGLLRALAQLLAGEQTSAAVDMARRWLARRAHLSTATVAQELAGLVAPRRLVAPVTASLFDAASLKRLCAAFPDAFFIRLRLHPRTYGRHLLATAEGQLVLNLAGAVDETTEPATLDPQILWLMAEKALSDFLAELPPERVLSQSVEDLVKDPATALAEIARALDLPAGDSAASAMMRPERSPFAGPGPMGAHLRGNIQSFAALAEALPEAEELAGPLPWRADAQGFSEDVRRWAETLGYS